MTELHKELELLPAEDDFAATNPQKPRVDELRTAESVPWDGLPEAADQGDYERRRSRRYTLPKIAFRIRVQRILNAAVDEIFASRIARLIFAAVPLISVGLIYFFLGHRMDLIEHTYVEFSELGQVETELLRIREVWSQEEMRSLAESVQNADQRRVFVDYRGLAQWLREKSEFAEQIDLVFSYTLQAGKASSIENMLEVPIEVVITTNEASADQTYLHFLEFMRYMVSSMWYVEIVEAAIESEGGGARQMTVMLRVWVHGTVRDSVETIQ